MAQKVDILPAELTELRAASTADGGTALTTTLGLISIPFGADYISITPRNFSGAAVAKYLLNPYLTIIVTTDALTSAIRDPGLTLEPTTIADAANQDISDEMQDGDAEDFAINSFDTAANNNFIYIGAEIPFRGVKVNLNNLNDTASVLTVKYPSIGGTSWLDISATDGTDVSGDTLKQDGDVTWTVPAEWPRVGLKPHGDTTRNDGPYGATLYWTRWEVSAAIDSTVDLVELRALNRVTTYSEYIEGQTVEVKTSNRRLGCIEALTNAGTANLLVNVGTLPGSEFD